MPATISSTFKIVVDETLTAGGVPEAAQFSIGRACRVVSFYVTGPQASRWAFANITTGVSLIAPFVVNVPQPLNDAPLLMIGAPDLANLEVAATDVLEIRCTGGTATRFVLECEASNPETLTVT